MGKAFRFIAALSTDGFRALGAFAWLLSIAFTVCKIFDVVSALRHVDYAWALLPITIWLLIAYVRRWQMCELILDQYPYALRLDMVDINVDERGDSSDPRMTRIISRNIGFALHWHNTIDRPIEYRMTKLTLDDQATNLGHAHEVISGKKGTIYYTSTIPRMPPEDGGWESFVIDLEATYGIPDEAPTRSITKKIRYNAHYGSKNVNFVYLENTERAL